MRKQPLSPNLATYLFGLIAKCKVSLHYVHTASLGAQFGFRYGFVLFTRKNTLQIWVWVRNLIWATSACSLSVALWDDCLFMPFHLSAFLAMALFWSEVYFCNFFIYGCVEYIWNKHVVWCVCVCVWVFNKKCFLLWLPPPPPNTCKRFIVMCV